MTVRPDITDFVAGLEVFSKRKLNYPLEVGELLQIAVQTGLTNEFDELIFQAKFLTRTQEVMKQIGNEAEGFEKLSGEYYSSLKKSMDLFMRLAGRAPADAAQKYSDIFFAMENESLTRVLKLYSDLSWIKNWQIDGKPLPYRIPSKRVSALQENIGLQTRERQQNGQTTKSLPFIQRSALLAVILMVLFLLIDPPVTILGWILSLGIMALLAYIIVQIVFLTRKPDTH